MGKALARELEHPRTRVDGDDRCPRTFRDVVRELPLAATHVEHAVTGVNAIHEEVVVTRQPMLRVNALVICDRTEIGAGVGVLIRLEELPHSLPLVALRPN